MRRTDGCDIIPRLMIVDFHTHCFPDRLAARAMASMVAKLEGRLEPVGDGTMGNLLDAMEKSGVDRCVLCQIATRPGQSDVLLETALAIREGRLGERARRAIVPFCSVHPDSPDFERRLAAIAEAGVKGVKLHPFYQDFRLDDPARRRYFEAARDLDLVVVCHCGFDPGFPNDGRCGPRPVAALLRSVPGLRFVAAHLGGWADPFDGDVSPLIDLGCMADTAVLAYDRPRPEPDRIMRSWPAELLLFGTDRPWNDYDEILAWVRERRSAADLELVFHGNAEKLLGIG